ncbi:hypothetical protein DFH07DRAFT_784964 [Mycena maculata]|uniref:Secreted protein n=1 Tax=Mycena maculata TaxID=230809 RepID=A0AAD7MI17_9AGAR|nr:hypothetical protein DFH07DRAFT_784964 [Mycena maculata]
MMQFRLFALLSLSAAVVSASVVGRHPASVVARAQPQPSSGSGSSWTCPDTNKNSQSKVTELCDAPPHSGTLFGCTYRTGSGTGTHACTYNTKTGECTGGSSDCPDSATSSSTPSHKKRDVQSF